MNKAGEGAKKDTSSQGASKISKKKEDVMLKGSGKRIETGKLKAKKRLF